MACADDEAKDWRCKNASGIPKPVGSATPKASTGLPGSRALASRRNVFQCRAGLPPVSGRNSRKGIRIDGRHGHSHGCFCGCCIHAGDEFVERSSAPGYGLQQGLAIGTLDARTPLPRLSFESLHDKLLVLHATPPSRLSLSRIMAGDGRYYVTMLNRLPYMRPRHGAELLLHLRGKDQRCRDRTSRAIRRASAPRRSALHRPGVKTSFSEPASPYSRRPQVRSWRQERFQVPPCSFSVALHGVASRLAQ